MCRVTLLPASCVLPVATAGQWDRGHQAGHLAGAAQRCCGAGWEQQVKEKPDLGEGKRVPSCKRLHPRAGMADAEVPWLSHPGAQILVLEEGEASSGVTGALGGVANSVPHLGLSAPQNTSWEPLTLPLYCLLTSPHGSCHRTWNRGQECGPHWDRVTALRLHYNPMLPEGEKDKQGPRYSFFYMRNILVKPSFFNSSFCPALAAQ